ncbi:MAG: ferric reductase-like transmembrane domain-containing protein [Acidimicrobiales bacterium]|nr:ferric reductase-like transmembrane domain-containing protein [Acidimicrobiales bacterium]
MTPFSLESSIAQSSTALWYFTRSAGLVALIALTASIVVGVVASIGWTTERWPRFLSQSVHRNLSLFCLGLVAIHVVTTVGDGYVPIGFLDAFIPFRSPYRPIWIGFGALTLDLMIAVLITSALRHRIGFQSWRFVHWLAYLCWPIALFHGLGSGTDASLPVVLAVNATCAAAVLTAVACRLISGRTFSVRQRTAATIGTVVLTVTAVVFAALGPLRPGWAHRSGTSPALLAQIAARYSSPSVPTSTSPSGSHTAPIAAPAVTGVPNVPFNVALDGAAQQAGPDTQGNIQVTLSMTLHDAASTPLDVILNGTAARGGGVSMSSGSVTFGPYRGVVTALDGGTLSATVQAQSHIQLVVSLELNRQSGAITGTVTGSSGTGTNQ